MRELTCFNVQQEKGRREQAHRQTEHVCSEGRRKQATQGDPVCAMQTHPRRHLCVWCVGVQCVRKTVCKR